MRQIPRVCLQLVMEATCEVVFIYTLSLVPNIDCITFPPSCWYQCLCVQNACRRVPTSLRVCEEKTSNYLQCNALTLVYSPTRLA